jgi:hypothetical protein
MNADIKARWLENLASGEYKKGQRTLRSRDNEFCCLGVLCDMYHKETGKGAWNETGGFNISADPEKAYWKWEYSLLPTIVAEWAGLASVNPVVKNTAQVKFIVDGDEVPSKVTLASVNDRTETFEYVIAAIKENL